MVTLRMKWNELLIMEIQKSIPSPLVLEIETLSYDEFHIHMFYDTVVSLSICESLVNAQKTFISPRKWLLRPHGDAVLDDD